MEAGISVTEEFNELRIIAQNQREKTDKLLDKIGTDGAYRVARNTHHYYAALMDLFVSQARVQASRSFKLAIYVSIAGFILLAASVALAVLEVRDGDIVFLTGVGGIISEFVSATLFWLYNKTLDQVNSMSDKIMKAQKEAFDEFVGSDYAINDLEMQE